MKCGSSCFLILSDMLYYVAVLVGIKTQPPNEGRYRHTLDAFLTIYRTEGVSAFYRGLFPSLLGIAHVAVQFPLYEKLKIWARELDFILFLVVFLLLICVLAFCVCGGSCFGLVFGSGCDFGYGLIRCMLCGICLYGTFNMAIRRTEFDVYCIWSDRGEVSGTVDERTNISMFGSCEDVCFVSYVSS